MCSQAGRRPAWPSARRTSRWRFGRKARDRAPASRGVDDGGAGVLAVRAGDSEEEREPAPEPEPPLASEVPLEHELPALESIVAPGPLGNPVQEHLERLADLGRELDDGPLSHETQGSMSPPGAHLLRMPTPVRRKLISA